MGYQTHLDVGQNYLMDYNFKLKMLTMKPKGCVEEMIS